jgi:hypothetical protein
MPEEFRATLPSGVSFGSTGPGGDDWIVVFVCRAGEPSLLLYLPAGTEFTLKASLPEGARLDPPIRPAPGTPRGPCDGK